jgi:hypothetical protein
LFLTQLQTFFETIIDWDVVIVAGNNMLPYTPISTCCIKVFNCQTTTGYIVKKHYYDTLISNYKEGISQLMKYPTNNDFKIDKYWFHLQRMNNWYLIIPLSVIQSDDYSDIEKKVRRARSYMLNYNKVIKNEL